MSVWARHQVFEKNSIILVVGILLVIAIGGLVEITPLFLPQEHHREVDGMRPYTPLELAGRNIYIREGCYLCHSQMVRPLRDEVERYGHYSLAAESMYDHPFQWGSKRTGPDLARVGGKYSDEWHVTHLKNPRGHRAAVDHAGLSVPGGDRVNSESIADHLRTNRTIGVPYDEDQIANAAADLKAQADPDNAGTDAFAKRYPKAVVRNFDGKGGAPDRDDALVAYLQMLGTLVDFKLYNEKPICAEGRHMKAVLTRFEPDIGTRDVVVGRQSSSGFSSPS